MSMIHPDFPPAFVERMAAQLGNELPAFLRACEEPYCRGIRLNPFKKTVNPEGLERPIPWEETGFYLTQESRAGAHILHEAGAWYLQEPSAMLPAAVLNVQPGERVLDLCAAPGGKSTQNALRMAGEGTIICNEPVPERARILSRNIERMGVPHAIVTCAYPDELADCWPEAFDAIQCDAPCSGEGMFRRHPETRAEWTPESPAGCAKRQKEILAQAVRMLRPGGRLVYSTCTLNPIENEGVVEWLLNAHPDLALKPFALPGLNAPDGMLTCYPHRIRGEGHFTALLVRQGDERPPWKAPAPEKSARAALQTALPWGRTANFARSIAPDEAELFALPELPAGNRLPSILRRGLHIGTVKTPRKGREPIFTPDHALALSIFPPDAPRIPLTEEQARAYQSGQTIPAEGKGWVLPCFEGVPLGWGKISDGVMKNHYPKGLRK